MTEGPFSFDETLNRIIGSLVEEQSKPPDVRSKKEDRDRLDQQEREAQIFSLQIEDLKNREALRRHYGRGAAWACVLQLIFLDVVLLMQGTGCLYISDTVFTVFITGTFAQIVAVVLLITGSIFKQDNKGGSIQSILTAIRSRLTEPGKIK